MGLADPDVSRKGESTRRAQHNIHVAVDATRMKDRRAIWLSAHDVMPQSCPVSWRAGQRNPFPTGASTQTAAMDEGTGGDAAGQAGPAAASPLALGVLPSDADRAHTSAAPATEQPPADHSAADSKEESADTVSGELPPEAVAANEAEPAAAAAAPTATPAATARNSCRVGRDCLALVSGTAGRLLRSGTCSCAKACTSCKLGGPYVQWLSEHFI